MTTESTVFFSGGLTDALSLSLYGSHEGPHRGGAGKGGWGKPGDEAKAPQESNEDGADAPEPEPEEPDNEVTIDDYEKEKAAKKAAITPPPSPRRASPRRSRSTSLPSRP